MITVVTGPPAVGKTTYVTDHAAPGELVIDYDHMAVALGSPDPHDHPPHIAQTAHAAYRAAIQDALANHHRQRVWIVQTHLTPGSEAGYRRVGAHIVRLDATRSQLHQRAASQGRTPQGHQRIDEYLHRVGRPD